VVLAATVLAVSGCRIETARPSAAPEAPQLPSDGVEQEFARYKAIIRDGLAHPERCRFGNGLPDEGLLKNRLDLIYGWTDPVFIEPLRRLLGHRSSDVRFTAITCLMRYDLPELDQELESFRDQKYPQFYPGDITEEFRVGSILDQYHESKILPRFRTIDVPLQVRLLTRGRDIEREVAFLHLVEVGWMPSFRRLGLDPLAVRELGGDDGWLDAALSPSRLLVGVDHAVDFCRELRERTADQATRDLATAVLWRLGRAEEAPACRNLLKSLIERLGRLDDPPYASVRPLVVLTDLPDPSSLDHYCDLAACHSLSLRELGLGALVRTDTDESMHLIERMDSTLVDERDLPGMFQVLTAMGQAATPHRNRWLGWLMSKRPAVLDWIYAAWIDAMGSMAGQDFGPNGRTFPHGLNVSTALATTAAIEAWYLQHRR
jgi:hypothetical protein